MQPIYKKVGKRYKQIGIYDDESFYLPKGAYLTVVDDGFRSTRTIIDTDDAGVIASLKGFEDELTAALVNTSQLRYLKPLTEEQKKLYDAFVNSLGDDGFYLSEYPSVRECVDSAISLALKKVKL